MEPIVVESLVVSTPDSQVRLFLGEHCLDFAPQDIVDYQELAPPPGLVEGSARMARVTLRAGASLLRVTSAAPYRSLLWVERHPFIFAARPVAPMGPDDGLRQKEDAYFAARGIVVERPAE